MQVECLDYFVGSRSGPRALFLARQFRQVLNIFLVNRFVID